MTKKRKGSVEHISTDLEIDEKLEMHEKGWKVQAAGLVFILALVLCAGVGVFGDGLVSKTKIIENSIEIEYQRFYRLEAIMELKIKDQNATDGLVISLPNSYLENFEIKSILPEPGVNRSKGGKVEYMFEGKDHINVTFYLIPRKTGNIESIVHVNNGQFTINHFIFP
jgi:hypothetical protein